MCCSCRSHRLHSNQLVLFVNEIASSSNVSYLILGNKGWQVMISKQETLVSPDTALYNLIIPRDNMLHQINNLVDFSFTSMLQRRHYTSCASKPSLIEFSLYKRGGFQDSSMTILYLVKFSKCFKCLSDSSTPNSSNSSFVSSISSFTCSFVSSSKSLDSPPLP